MTLWLNLDSDCVAVWVLDGDCVAVFDWWVIEVRDLDYLKDFYKHDDSPLTVRTNKKALAFANAFLFVPRTSGARGE
ncbi:MAG: hypothetical protein WC340_18350 [Kiritimatiellia bacterium]